MKRTNILTAVLLGASSLALSTGAFAYDVVTTEVVDPVTGVVEGSANVVTNVTNGFIGYTPNMYHNTEYVVTDVDTGTSKMVMGLGNAHDLMSSAGNCANNVFPHICDGVKYTITNTTTGKSYSVKGIKKGTMDVLHGTRTVRYEYVVPLVTPL